MRQLYSTCAFKIKAEIDDVAIKICPSGFCRVPGMDELCTSVNDISVETPRVIGPFGIFPFTIMRCIYIVKGDCSIEIVILPRKWYGGHEGSRRVIQTGDVTAFDYNRDCHLLLKNYEYPHDDDTDCVIMQLHYVRKQLYYSYFARVNILWNSLLRYTSMITSAPGCWVCYVVQLFAHYSPPTKKSSVQVFPTVTISSKNLSEQSS